MLFTYILLIRKKNCKGLVWSQKCALISDENDKNWGLENFMFSVVKQMLSWKSSKSENSVLQLASHHHIDSFMFYSVKRNYVYSMWFEQNVEVHTKDGAFIQRIQLYPIISTVT